MVRYLAVAAAALSLVACGSSYRATRPVTAPFVKEPLSVAGGRPVVGSSSERPGLTLDYGPNQRFEIGIAVDNDSRATVVVTRVRALEPARTLVRQVATVLTLWDPPKCRTPSCPFRGFPITPLPTTALQPVKLGPGQRVGVGLDFMLQPCSAVPTARRAAPSRIEVTFHVPGGRTKRQILHLGWSSLLLRFRNSRCGVQA